MHTLEGMLHRPYSMDAAAACCRAKPLGLCAGKSLRAIRCALWLGPTTATCFDKLLKLCCHSCSVYTLNRASSALCMACMKVYALYLDVIMSLLRMQTADAQILSRREAPSPKLQPVANDSSTCWWRSKTVGVRMLVRVKSMHGNQSMLMLFHLGKTVKYESWPAACLAESADKVMHGMHGAAGTPESLWPAAVLQDPCAAPEASGAAAAGLCLPARLQLCPATQDSKISLPCRHMKAAWVCDTALLCTIYKSIEKA